MVLCGSALYIRIGILGGDLNFSLILRIVYCGNKVVRLDKIPYDCALKVEGMRLQLGGKIFHRYEHVTHLNCECIDMRNIISRLLSLPKRAMALDHYYSTLFCLKLDISSMNTANIICRL